MNLSIIDEFRAQIDIYMKNKYISPINYTLNTRSFHKVTDGDIGVNFNNFKIIMTPKNINTKIDIIPFIFSDKFNLDSSNINYSFLNYYDDLGKFCIINDIKKTPFNSNEKDIRDQTLYSVIDQTKYLHANYTKMLINQKIGDISIYLGIGSIISECIAHYLENRIKWKIEPKSIVFRKMGNILAIGFATLYIYHTIIDISHKRKVIKYSIMNGENEYERCLRAKGLIRYLEYKDEFSYPTKNRLGEYIYFKSFPNAFKDYFFSIFNFMGYFQNNQASIRYIKKLIDNDDI